MTRNEYESHVVATMITDYCRSYHGSHSPCPECAELIDYCTRRIAHCPLKEAKSSCRLCTIHCYDTAHREQIRRLMRTMGPRMIFTRPLMALRHLLNEWQSRPASRRPPQERTP